MNPQTSRPMMQSETTGRGEPLVLAPGGLTGWLSWMPHAEALSGTRRVIRLQLLNVELGRSGEPLPPEYSTEHEVTAMANALDELALERADFAGWSYGGAVALSYAIRNPQRVRTLTLIEPPAFWVLRSRGPLAAEWLEEQRQTQALAVDDVSEDNLVWFAHFAGFVPVDVDPRTLPPWPSSTW